MGPQRRGLFCIISLYFKIYNGLLEPKHIEAMSEAVWLYMWFQEKNTSVNENGEGKVLGNKPIKYEDDIKPALGVSRATYKRWINILRDAGYIKTIRSPYGLTVVITKAKKFMPVASDGSNPTITPQIDEEMAQNRTTDGSKSYSDGSKVAMQYKTIQVHNKDNTTTTNVVGQKAVYGKPEINDLFDYWEKVVGYPIKSKVKTNRNACSTLIKSRNADEMKRLINGVALAHEDRYAPSVSDFVELQSNMNRFLAWGRKRHIQNKTEEIVRI